MKEKSNIDRLNEMINELKGDVCVFRANNRMMVRMNNCIENIDSKMYELDKKMTSIVEEIKKIKQQITNSNRALTKLRKENAALEKKLAKKTK